MIEPSRKEIIMAFEDAFAGTLLSEKAILLDFEELKEYYSDMGVSAKILMPTEETPMPTLAAVLPPDEQNRPRVLTHTFQPLEKEDAEYTKFLQFYAELPVPLDKIPRASLLEALCGLSLYLPTGAPCLIPARDGLHLPQTAALRVLQGFPISESIDQGVFTEAALLFNLSCDIMTMVLDALAAGKSPDEAIALLRGE